MTRAMIGTMLAALAGALWCAPAGAATSPCMQKASTQMAMDACAGADARSADARLSAAYGALLARAASQPGAPAKIRAAERAWTAYRDAYLAAAFPLADKQTAYGSIYPMEAAELRAQVTLRQVDAIDALIARYRSP